MTTRLPNSATMIESIGNTHVPEIASAEVPSLMTQETVDTLGLSEKRKQDLREGLAQLSPQQPFRPSKHFPAMEFHCSNSNPRVNRCQSPFVVCINAF